MLQRFFQNLSLRNQELQRFPLIELTVVVACIGILASIAIQRLLTY